MSTDKKDSVSAEGSPVTRSSAISESSSTSWAMNDFAIFSRKKTTDYSELCDHMDIPDAEKPSKLAFIKLVLCTVHKFSFSDHTLFNSVCLRQEKSAIFHSRSSCKSKNTWVRKRQQVGRWKTTFFQTSFQAGSRFNDICYVNLIFVSDMQYDWNTGCTNGQSCEGILSSVTYTVDFSYFVQPKRSNNQSEGIPCLIHVCPMEKT